MPRLTHIMTLLGCCSILGACGSDTTTPATASGGSAAADAMASDGTGSDAGPASDSVASDGVASDGAGTTDAASPAAGDASRSGPQTVEVAFSARTGDTAVGCATPWTAGKNAVAVQLAELRFYLHDVHLLAGAATESVALDQDALWQNGQVALIDLADGQGKCQPSSPETRATVRGKVSQGRAWDGIRFTLGVPEVLNHGDPTTAAAPLDRTAMFWNWLDGYKFLRLDMASPAYALHIGSTGCTGSPGKPTQCSAANRAVIEVRGFDPTQQPVVLDVAALLAGVQLGSDKACMSKPGATACAGPFAALGLDGAGQTAFRKP